MTVHRKALLIILATLTAMIAVVFALAATILVKSAAQSERNQVEEATHRLQDALARELSLLNNMVRDYSAWDDSYNYVETPNPEHIETNHANDAMIENRYNFVAYLNQAGAVVFGKCMDLTEGQEQEIPIPDSLAGYLAPGTPLTSHATTESHTAGLLALEDRILLVVSWPIIKSNYEGPIRGSLIMARFFDERQVQELSTISNLKVASHALNRPAPPEHRNAFARLSPEKPIYMQPLDRNTMLGYVLISDIMGRPAVALTVELPRTYHHQLQENLVVLLAALALIGAAMSIMMLSLLERMILRRVSRLGEFVTEVKTSDSLALRLALPGNDELSQLAESINEMLGTLESDVAERRIANEVLRSVHELEIAKKSAEMASQAKSLFLANMTHELRTPLNAILGMTELMLDTELSEQQGKMLRALQTESLHLAEIIGDILDFSKLEAGKIVIEKIPFDLQEVADSVSRSFTLEAARRGLNFSSSISGNVPQHLLGDPGRIRQILLNLVGNALKFTPAGGINMTAELLQESPDAAEIRFCVTDTGIGISREKQALIFESFTQADSSIARQYGGTGLGTTICKRLVELMGGQIGVNSETGVGSTFWFQIPFLKGAPASAANHAKDPGSINASGTATLAAPAAGPGQPPNSGPSPHSARRILLAEDYPTNQTVVTQHLTRAGYLVDVAENGQQAVDAWKSQEYSLILMDIQMPGMDGIEATRAIRDMEASRATVPGGTAERGRTPILGLTAHAVKDFVELSRDAGMDGCLLKPIGRANLLEAVAKWMEIPVSGAEAGSARETGQTPMDWPRALFEFDGDQALLNQVADAFILNVREQLARMSAGILAGDADTVRQEAHSIKGGAGNLMAAPLARRATTLEQTAKTGDFPAAGASLNELKDEFEHFVLFIQNMRDA